MSSRRTKSAIDQTEPFNWRITHKRVVALGLILVSLFMLIQGNRKLDSATRSIITFESGDIKTVLPLPVPDTLQLPPRIVSWDPDAVEYLPHIIAHTRNYMNFAAGLFLLGGLVALLDLPALRRISRALLIACGLMVIPTLLIAAASGGRTNATTMLTESLRLATPIAIGAMAGIWCERTGVVNIAIEGMMLFGAGFGFMTLYFLRENLSSNMALSIAVLVAVGVGGLAALLHAWLSITFRTDQIISGTVINIMAVGATSFVRREYLQSTEAGMMTLPSIAIPGLSKLPILGDTLFTSQPIFYLMFLIVLFTQIMLFYTRWGLRVRAVGEHPSAADTLGVNVNRTRWVNVFVAGLIAGLAGAWFSLEATGRFNDSMTSGAGFIALAAMIFGKWRPLGAFGAALLFGFANALGTRLQMEEVPTPPQFLQMVPYVVTVLVLAGFIGHATAPKADGVPYVKEGQ